MDSICCVTAVYNAAGYRSRVENYLAFAGQLSQQGVPLLTVEIAFGDRPFELPESANVHRLRGESPLWLKECAINLAMSLLPTSCAGVAWLDCDILFPANDWFERLEELLGVVDIVQLFERMVHLPPGHRKYRGEDAGIDTSIAAQAGGTPDWLSRRRRHVLPFAVTGAAWAARRSVFAEVGLYDRLILGNGDAFLADCLFDSFGIHHYAAKRTPAMIADMEDWRRRFLSGRVLRVGHLPGEIHHLWHGTFEDRQYTSRDEILLRHGFDPRKDIVRRGALYEWCSDKPGLHAEVEAYFRSRREDDL